MLPSATTVHVVCLEKPSPTTKGYSIIAKLPSYAFVDVPFHKPKNLGILWSQALVLTDKVFYPVLYTTNEAGMAYISDFLLEKHKHGEAITGDKKMMSAWAREAEDAIGNCGCPCFEIPSYFITSGRSEVCFL